MTDDFGTRLLARFASHGHLCVGIDPHPYLLDDWGLPDNADGVREFGLRVVDAAAGTAGIVKPQVAFFERHGSAGYVALERVLAQARAAGLLVIADAKRGDIGSTAEAYGQAWLRPGSPLEADAMTINPFQGVGSLVEPIRLALENGKGLFLLAATSNPESIASQTAVLNTGEFGGKTVAAGIVDEVSKSNGGALGSLGVVIGATVRLADYGISDSGLARTPVLGPGFGHQGVDYDAVHSVYGSAVGNVVISSSREILRAGPTAIAGAVRSNVERVARAYAV